MKKLNLNLNLKCLYEFSRPKKIVYSFKVDQSVTKCKILPAKSSVTKGRN